MLAPVRKVEVKFLAAYSCFSSLSMVTGIRRDAWANAHHIPSEEDKQLDQRGTCLHWELQGTAADQQTNAKRRQSMAGGRIGEGTEAISDGFSPRLDNLRLAVRF